MKISIVSISFIAILFSTIFPSVWIVTAKVANGKETIIGLQPGQNTTTVNSFSYNRVLNISNDNHTSADPQIDISGNNTFVVWSDDSPGNADIFFTKSTDGGNTFSDKPMNLSKNTGNSAYPIIAVHGNTSYVVWEDNSTGNFDILLKKSTDGGNTFSDKPMNLSKNKGNSSDPEVFSDEKKDVYVVWDDDSPGNADIFFTKSTDGGETFSKPVNLSNNTRGSFDPALTISKNHIYVAWDDDSPGNAFVVTFLNHTSSLH